MLFRSACKFPSHDTAPARKDILVPIHFAQKDKILSRLEIEPDLNSKKAITLPILSTELTGFTYDATRNLQATQSIITNTGGFLTTPVPFIINLDLHVMAHNLEDAFQIVEQIIPFFKPDLTVKFYKDTGQPVEYSFILNNMSQTLDYEGEMANRRIIIYTLSFTVRVPFYGPVLNDKSPVIKKVIIDTYVKDSDHPSHITQSIEVDPFYAEEDDPFELKKYCVELL